MSTEKTSFAPRPVPAISRRCSLDEGCMARRRKTKMPAEHRRCSFSTISVREYDQTVGDHPSCQEGAPITLGWKYAEQESISLDEFEKTREPQRRGRSDLILGVAERRRMLVKNGSTLMEILHAERFVAMKNGMASMGRQISQNIPTPSKMHSRSQRQGNPQKSMVSRAA